MRKLRFVFGGFSRRSPSMTSILRRIATRPASKFTSDHRKPSSSPRRIPVPTSTAMGSPSSARAFQMCFSAAEAGKPHTFPTATDELLNAGSQFENASFDAAMITINHSAPCCGNHYLRTEWRSRFDSRNTFRMFSFFARLRRRRVTESNQSFLTAILAEIRFTEVRPFLVHIGLDRISDEDRERRPLVRFARHVEPLVGEVRDAWSKREAE